MNTHIRCSCGYEYNFQVSLVCPECGVVYRKHLEELALIHAQQQEKYKNAPVIEGFEVIASKSPARIDFKMQQAGER